MIDIRVDPYPSDVALGALMTAAWGTPWSFPYQAVLTRSLAHLGAYDGERLVGFVNVAWDGGVHASIFDTATHPDHGRRGLATDLVRRAAALARDRGAGWLHVDYEPHLERFYAGCGFRPTKAGLIDLTQLT